MGRAKADDGEVDGISITTNEVTISWHCRVSCARVLYEGNGSSPCLAGTSKRSEPCCSLELEINANVSSNRTRPQSKSDANAAQPNRVSTDIVMTATANAIEMNSFLPSPLDQPGLIYASSVKLSKLKLTG